LEKLQRVLVIYVEVEVAISLSIAVGNHRDIIFDGSVEK